MPPAGSWSSTGAGRRRSRPWRPSFAGSFELATPGGPIRIRARADRVEVRRDGSLAILDYKTGTLPTAPEVRSGIRPQLLIEAMIAAEGGFPDVPAAVPTELLYWGLKGAEESPGEEKAPCGEEIEALLATARLGLTRLLAHFADPDTAYIAVPHPEIAPDLQRLRPPGPHRRVARRRDHAVSVANAPTPAQRRAADPTRSVWVTANAGTGKTRVLSDRVLRLLLAGAAPESILCLTFTKAAAAEMAVRIEGRLAGWAVERDEARLHDDLLNLLGEPPSARTLKDARRLFARVLDLARGLNIMTIHSFCQTLLRRFPLEAGVAPHFETIDDRTAAELMNEARQIVLAERCISEPDLQKAVEILAVTLAESTLTEAIREMLGQRQRLTACFARHHPDGRCDGLLARIEHLLEVEAGAEPPQLIARACADGQFDHLGLYRIANQLVQSDKKTDVDAGSTILTWLNAAEADRILYFDKYSRSFLTQDGKPRKQLCTKRFVDTCLAVLTMEQARLVHLHDSIEALTHARRTAALLRLGHAVIREYEELKRRGSLLDFDDLIEHARRLLSTPGRKEWVLFKLDERLDHVLVDEAQDTSPAQWEIVERLSEEFLAGLGAHPGPRTLFVVGDEKQSIYSFQGADLENFRSVRDKLRGLAAAAPFAFAEETLDLSFRSARAVLESVDRVLARPELVGVVRPGETVHHDTNRANAPGLVELWPLAAHDEATAETEPWPLPDQPRRTDEPQRRVADGIAAQVQAWLTHGELVDGEDGPRPIRPGDVLVLVSRRDTIQQLTIRALKGRGIPVAGADRLPLAEHIAVRDLIALGRAILLPEDDLNLACLLKSPLLGLDEDQLFDLAYDRGHLKPARAPKKQSRRRRRIRCRLRAPVRLDGPCGLHAALRALHPRPGRRPRPRAPPGPPRPRRRRAHRGLPRPGPGLRARPPRLPRRLPPLAGARPPPAQARPRAGPRRRPRHDRARLQGPRSPHRHPRRRRPPRRSAPRPAIWHEDDLPLWRHSRFRHCEAAIEAGEATRARGASAPPLRRPHPCARPPVCHRLA